MVIKVEGNADTEEAVTEYIFSYEKIAAEPSQTPITVNDQVVVGAPITVNDPQPIPAALVGAANEVEKTVDPVENTESVKTEEKE